MIETRIFFISLIFYISMSLSFNDNIKISAFPERETVIRSATPLNNAESKDWNCETVNACDDELGFEAILNLHQRLDDDADGNIDTMESDEFLRGELNYKSGNERQKRFHRNDKHISVDELWVSWKSSEVHNWTVDETLVWLQQCVDLPQYVAAFKEHSIDGASLPRLAVNNQHFLSNLGIKDPIHKHKISLKAMDIVLFGLPRNHNYFKDVILALSVGLATVGCWFAFIQHKKSQSHLKKTMKDMESLQWAEEALITLQKQLDEAKLEQEKAATEKKDLERRIQDGKKSLIHQSTNGNLDTAQTKIQKLEQELKEVAEDLKVAEQALQNKNWQPPSVLQHWLQMTHELELQHHNQKKSMAEKQLFAAKEGCEKLRKKRTSFMGAFRVAHSNAIYDVDNRILAARTALSEITKDLQERLNRWKEIEALCGFSIVHNLGIRHLESVLDTSTAVTSPSNVHSLIARRSSEGTLADEGVCSALESDISARSTVNLPITTNQEDGQNVNLESIDTVSSTKFRTVSSSNAILQRSNAFSCDVISIKANSSTDLSMENVLIKTIRPKFTVG